MAKERKKHPGGRPTKLTPELLGEMVDLVQAGNYADVAAAAVGVARQTHLRWLKRGARELARVEETATARPRKTELLYVEYCTAVKSASARAECADVMTIRNAARSQWQAAAWRLERKHAERWGRNSRVEMSGPGGDALPIMVYLPDNGRAMTGQGHTGSDGDDAPRTGATISRGETPPKRPRE